MDICGRVGIYAYDKQFDIDDICIIYRNVHIVIFKRYTNTMDLYEDFCRMQATNVM